ncbi:hypothetical protein ACHAXT_008659 [Thalassiosira profunda]
MKPPSTPLALLLVFAIMLRCTSSLAARHSDRTRVAVLGGGVAGCSFASSLLASPGRFDITIFEGGRGVGGRTSTRQVELEDGRKMQFDHGCPSIDPPRTDAFRSEVDKWKERGWVQPWKGSFAKITKKEGKLTYEEMTEERLVGVPTMSALCQQLLQTKSEHSTIQVATGSQARATHLPSYPEAASIDDVANAEDNAHIWRLEKRTAQWARGKEGMQQLGDFDYLVSTDRNSFKPGRLDFAEARLDEFRQSVNERVGSLPMITAMVAFDDRLPLTADVIDLEGADDRFGRFGMLGKLIRDSSKPGRHEEGEGACDRWVLHGSREAGERLLGELKGKPLKKIRTRIRESLNARQKIGVATNASALVSRCNSFASLSKPEV